MLLSLFQQTPRGVGTLQTQTTLQLQYMKQVRPYNSAWCSKSIIFTSFCSQYRYQKGSWAKQRVKILCEGCRSCCRTKMQYCPIECWAVPILHDGFLSLWRRVCVYPWWHVWAVLPVLSTSYWWSPEAAAQSGWINYQISFQWIRKFLTQILFLSL